MEGPEVQQVGIAEQTKMVVERSKEGFQKLTQSVNVQEAKNLGYNLMQNFVIPRLSPQRQKNPKAPKWLIN